MCKDPEMSLDLFGNQELPNVWGGGWWVGRSSCRRSPSHLPSWKGSELENRSGHCRGRVWERSNDVMEEGKEALSWDSKFKKKKKENLYLCFLFAVTKDLSKMTQSKNMWGLFWLSSWGCRPPGKTHMVSGARGGSCGTHSQATKRHECWCSPGFSRLPGPGPHAMEQWHPPCYPIKLTTTIQHLTFLST